MSGTVCFVGLGPGDPKLRTERAAARLAGADDVVEGEEVAPERLVELARAGRQVARAVRGDASESTRAMAEAIAVSAAGIGVEIVPGVGAAAAAGAFAGVRARAVWVLPASLAGALSAEKPDAPVTLVAGAGLPSQRLVATTAAEAPAVGRSFGGDAPILLAFGAPEPALRWFERRPLFGKRILVTRARSQAGAAADLLREQGADPVVVPTIEIRPPADPAALESALSRLAAGEYAWVVFTSANGVEAVWRALAGVGRDARAFGAARLAAIGPATALALESHGLRPDVIATEHRAEGLVADLEAAIPRGNPATFLLPRAAKARDVLPDALRSAGHRVDVVPAYETHPPAAPPVEALARELDLGRIDAVTFTSSSTVDNLCDLLGGSAPAKLRPVRVASIGPITTETAQRRGLRVDVTARRYTVAGLVEALAESYAARG